MLWCFMLSETTSSIYDSELQPTRGGMEGKGGIFQSIAQPLSVNKYTIQVRVVVQLYSWYTA